MPKRVESDISRAMREMDGSHSGLAGAAPDDEGGRAWIHAMVREMCWVTWEIQIVYESMGV